MTARELPAGTLVGDDFRIVSTLAEGGMGVVYVALQLSTQKQRALKVMTPQPGDLEALRRRFEREAHLSSKIESDHVVEVIGAGVDRATNMPYMAMELLDGEDLEAYLGRVGHLEWLDAWNVAGELCHALEAAHRIGVVHRDLKPSNVFLARSRRPGVAREVKVLDFGIAKQTSDTGKTTGTLGTPLYMSPEQTVAGSTFTPATDVWALGLLVFEMLVGLAYWKTASATEGQIAMLLREVILEPLAPASQRAKELGAEGRLPPGFDAWFARCVVRDPQSRFADAGIAYSALSGVLAEATGRPDGMIPPPSSVLRPQSSAELRAPAPTAREARTQRAFTTGTGSAPRSRPWLLLGGAIGGGVALAAAAFVVLRQPPSTTLPPSPEEAVAPSSAAPAVAPAPPAPSVDLEASPRPSASEVAVAPSAEVAPPPSSAAPRGAPPKPPPRVPPSAPPAAPPALPPAAPPKPPSTKDPVIL